MSGVIENILERLGELEGSVASDGVSIPRILDRLEALEAKAKPGPVFTARAGETFTVKCEIPSCEVCAAQGKI